jgi:hypothetical protein
MQVQALVARAPPWEAVVRAMDALGPGVEDIKVAAWMCNPDAFADKEGDGRKARGPPPRPRPRITLSGTRCCIPNACLLQICHNTQHILSLPPLPAENWPSQDKAKGALMSKKHAVEYNLVAVDALLSVMLAAEERKVARACAAPLGAL